MGPILVRTTSGVTLGEGDISPRQSNDVRRVGELPTHLRIVATYTLSVRVERVLLRAGSVVGTTLLSSAFHRPGPS